MSNDNAAVVTCNMHDKIEDKLRKQDIHYAELSRLINVLHRSVMGEMSTLNKKVETVHTKLVGDLNSDSPGWIQKVMILEAESLKFNKNQEQLQKTIQKIVPWFMVFKWSILTLGPVMLGGAITLFVGLLLGKIQIIM